ncbi:MAG: cofactor-independent phosphoglycerate mutase [Calditerrivibrio sp.]|nr:cofactor-independent phosphoglycerate mutase [Calditerrivibrio sp.]MCA1932030.1 cofactor-independent phosphoglycerate mutase [Calditerrivibrio sp.]MCA1979936.1 cofactor-independent phosphoglycerate mutase [Calditerrivibrio sp.]
MKYFVLLCDGMSDYRIESLGNKTIIEYANTSNFDFLAKNGKCGFIKTTPDGMYPGSDICNLSIFGYDPTKYYTGRSPIEAASIGINLGEKDFAFRCNFVTLADNYTVMEDFTAHHIDNYSAKRLISKLQDYFSSEGLEFYPGVGYRNLLVIRDAEFNLKTTPPHDIIGKKIDSFIPQGDGSGKINHIMNRAIDILKSENSSANAIWLWGEGRKPSLPNFKDLYGVDGSVIAAVDLIRGIGRLAGLEVIDVPGVTGFIDTNFEGKARYAVESLKNKDYVFVHVEAPDESGHMGRTDLKIQAVENINNIMLPIIIEGLKQFGEFRILITPDHPTPISLRTHAAELVPAIIYGTSVEPDENMFYSEFIKPSFIINEGYKIADFFINSRSI